MMTALLTAIVIPMAACGGGSAVEAAPASMLAAASNASPEFHGSAPSPVTGQSVTPVQLTTSAVPLRLDVALAALGGAAQSAGQSAKSLQGSGWIEFVLDAPSSDDFALQLQYTHAGSTSAALSVRINDGQAQQVLLAPTGLGQVFIDSPALVVSLTAGRNLVRLQAEEMTDSVAAAAGEGPAIVAVTLQPLLPLDASADTVSGGAIGNADSGTPVAPTDASDTVVAQASPAGASNDPTAVTAPAPGTSAPPPINWANPRASARIFISGHSLTDNPLGDQIVSVANSLGGSRAARYNQQIVIGSPIRFRTDRNANWAGYSRGKNRDGGSINVINELRSPSAIGGDRYDTLVIAENHNSLQMLQWEDTVRNLRHYHDLFIAGNAGGRTLFYETWIDVNDKSNPAAWIAHERAQSRAWQCIATRVNTSLAAEGRPDRITPLPVGAALVDLVERATQGRMPGITQATTAATINTLLSDNVHLTRTGVYYMALVSYAAIYQRSPVGASVPAGVSSEAAASLQEAAWRFVSEFYSQYREPSLEACREDLAQNFCSTYWTYRGQAGNIAGCRRIFGGTGADNPLLFDPATNASHWFPAP